MVVFFFGHYGGDQFISPLKVETDDTEKHFKKNKNCFRGTFICPFRVASAEFITVI